MPRSYDPRPWVDKTGVAFVDTGMRASEEHLRLRRQVSLTPPRSLFAQLRDEWSARRPYYIILFSVSAIVMLALSLLIYASLS
jgi:hypothetical protein